MPNSDTEKRATRTFTKLSLATVHAPVKRRFPGPPAEAGEGCQQHGLCGQWDLRQMHHIVIERLQIVLSQDRLFHYQMHIQNIFKAR